MSATIDQQIYDAAVSRGFNPTSAKLIVAQARHETGNYTSNIFKLNNNLFGMKFVKQPLATQGSASPRSEGDFYARYKSVGDSVKDLIDRNYTITRGGITPEQLKNATDSLDFATKLKARGYYGDTISNYANGLKSALTRINIVEFVQKNKGKILILGIGLLLVSVSFYLYNKNK
jgi:uncharacterized FlgJ-related protein